MLNGLEESFLAYDTSKNKELTTLSMEILNEYCKHVDFISTRIFKNLETHETLIPISRDTKKFPIGQITQKIGLELMCYPTIYIYEKYFIESISRIAVPYANYFSVKTLYGIPKINEK